MTEAIVAEPPEKAGAGMAGGMGDIVRPSASAGASAAACSCDANDLVECLPRAV